MAYLILYVCAVSDGAVLFSRTSRSYNSLPRHLPSSYSVPYGYKIDLDFVRFCDSYYDSRDGQRPASRLRRTKRSHKKSYNTLLGLHREKGDRPKPVSPPAQVRSERPPAFCICDWI